VPADQPSLPDLASRKVELLGRLTGPLIHDLNNMLAAVSSTVSLLERSELGERGHRYVEMARSAVDRGKELVDRIAVFSRSESQPGRSVLLRRTVDNLRVLLEQAIGTDRHLVIDLPESLVVTADPHELEVTLLERVLAARATVPRGGTVTIRARSFGPTDDSDADRAARGPVLVTVTGGTVLRFEPGAVLTKAGGSGFVR
jgi:signal transduction histidine kinase